MKEARQVGGRRWWLDRLAWLVAYAGTLLSLAWTRELVPAYLALSGAAIVGVVLLVRFGRTPRAGLRHLGVAVAMLVLGLISGAVIAERFAEIAEDWSSVVVGRQAQRASVVAQRMSVLEQRGRSAASLAAAAASNTEDRRGLFAALERVREEAEVDALVVFDESGGLRAWAGEHRGGIPDEVRIGATGTFFVERPLYSYVYFSRPVQGRGSRAVAAVLVETGLVSRPESGALTATFAGRGAMEASFRAGSGRGPGIAWSLVEGGDTVVHARLEPVTQAVLRAELEQRARLFGVVCGLIALAFLSVGWLRAARPRGRLATALPLVWALVALPLTPLGPALGLDRLYSPLLFVLPIPGDFTLGVVLAALLPLGALAATTPPSRRSGRSYLVVLGLGALAVAFGYAGAIGLFLNAATPLLLEDGPSLWIGLQFTATLLLAVLTALALPRHRPAPEPRAAHPRIQTTGAFPIAAGLLVATLLGLFTLLALEPTRSPRTTLAALWAAPFLIIGGGMVASTNVGHLTRWLTAGWLAVSAVLPHFWIAHANARLEAAANELSSLGVQSPPFLDYLLHELAQQAIEREALGEDGLQLLYRSWVASGLAQEPYGAHVMLWSSTGVPLMELGLGGAEGSTAEAAIVWPLVRTALTTGDVQLGGVSGLPEVTKVLAAPLESGRAVSVSVPPRRTLDQPSAVAPFLGAPADPEMRLTLVDVQGSEEPTSGIRWTRSSEGWRSEAVVRFPDGDYHAHLEVRIAPLGIRLARGVLLLALDLTLLFGIWWLGHAVRGRLPWPRGGLRRLSGSFRVRVTLALLLFFLVPTALFGYVAYRALAGEVERSARLIAERAVRQAVAEFPQPTSDLRELATRAGTDVLRYLDGELADVSSPETLELGVYNAWMPSRTFLELELSGEESVSVEAHDVGQQSFLMAYHRVRPAGVLAVPTALTAGDAAVRQRELAHLILFAALIGGILSLALSVAVGRALAGPIGRLKRAAAAVGSGRLHARLPEAPGEFGQLFASFNRMTRRLRRARTQELRTARVLAWGEMARQIAHEIKNPLTPIKLAVQHLRRAYQDGRPDFGEILEENVEQILTEIDRLTEIARAFSRYGAPDELAGPIAPVDVGTVVHEALTLYRAGDPKVRYAEEVEPSLPAGRARSGELKEVILNLLENARTALEGRGDVVVRAYQVDSRIELEVEDNGPGIPPELLPRIFEPHFSTRSAGTGLGLPIVRRIVESWGGSVTAESEPGRGTTVRVRILPVTQS